MRAAIRARLFLLITSIIFVPSTAVVALELVFTILNVIIGVIGVDKVRTARYQPFLLHFDEASAIAGTARQSAISLTRMAHRD